MADTQPREAVTSSVWVDIVVGPITSGTISAESHQMRVAITTGAAPTDLTQGHLVNPNFPWPFNLDTGETLYVVANSVKTTVIATY